MRYLIVAVMLFAGCKSVGRRAAEEQLDCVYQALKAPGITEGERVHMMQGCRSVYILRTAR